MVFNSPVFVIFLIIVFALYWGPFAKKYKAQNLLIVIASYFFYGWWDWRFLSLLLFSSIIDFTTAIYIQQTNKNNIRKFLLGISLVTNLGLLGVFKYYDFFVTSFIDAFSFFNISLNATTLNIILPVGISFYTFQTLSYTIDVYRKQLTATKDFIAFSAFVSFFPQLVAGPIERATHLLPQFQKPRIFDNQIATSGLKLMAWGFFKKIVIADNVAQFVEIVYKNPENFHGSSIILGTLFFSIQIYCDFSGYSDIAIGCSRLFGFDLMKNFNVPYFASSPREFWRKWHISLSTWFRDYLYIPLGGNKTTFRRTQFNLLLTFIISGLWHGANLTFVIWGYLHGIVMNMQNVFTHYKIKLLFPKPIAILFTFLFISFAWIFFRAENVEDAFLIINNMFHTSTTAEKDILFKDLVSPLMLVASLGLFFIMEVCISNEKLRKLFTNQPAVIRWSGYYFIIFWIIIFGAWNVKPNFIYFQF